MTQPQSHSHPLKGPFRLVTVNTSADRAQRLIGKMISQLSDRYDITHIANCSTIEDVAPTVRKYQPNVLFSASMWTDEEAARIRKIAESERPGVKTHAIPQGLQVERGPEAVVEYLVEKVPGLLDGM